MLIHLGKGMAALSAAMPLAPDNVIDGADNVVDGADNVVA